jgi:hypothetical protein
MEYVNIVASTEAVFNKLYNCADCLSKFKDPESTRKQQEIKSCFKPSDYRFQISNIKFKKCPGNYTIPQVGYFLTLFFNYEKHGVFPDAGGLFDQNYKLWEILSIIEGVVADNRKKMQNDIDRKNKAKGRK